MGNYPGLGLLPSHRRPQKRGGVPAPRGVPHPSVLLLIITHIPICAFESIQPRFICSQCFHPECRNSHEYVTALLLHNISLIFMEETPSRDLYLSCSSPGSTESRLTTIQHKTSPPALVVCERSAFLTCSQATSLIECSYLKHTPDLMSKKWPGQTTTSVRAQYGPQAESKQSKGLSVRIRLWLRTSRHTPRGSKQTPGSVSLSREPVLSAPSKYSCFFFFF